MRSLFVKVKCAAYETRAWRFYGDVFRDVPDEFKFLIKEIKAFPVNGRKTMKITFHDPEGFLEGIEVLEGEWVTDDFKVYTSEKFAEEFTYIKEGES